MRLAKIYLAGEKVLDNAEILQYHTAEAFLTPNSLASKRVIVAFDHINLGRIEMNFPIEKLVIIP